MNEANKQDEELAYFFTWIFTERVCLVLY
jgi:hypothetical protein